MTKNRIKIFIGGSKESETETNLIAKILTKLADDPTYQSNRYKFEITPWNKPGVWQNGISTHENLLRIVNEFDFAVLLWVGDDKLDKRGVEGLAPRDNLIYEAGLFIGRLSSRKTFILQNNAEKIHIPSDRFGVTTKRFTWDKSSTQGIPDEDLTTELETVCREILNDVEKIISENSDFLDKDIFNNPLLESLVHTVKLDLKKGLEKLPRICEFPASEYPFHLISLQERFRNNLTVKALALINQQERFWQSHYGDKIVATTGNKSRRIFAFTNEIDFSNNFPHLQRHFDKYEIRVTSLDKLLFYGMPKKDFAVIELKLAETSHKLLAEYNRETRFEKIIFETDVDEIKKHELIYEKIWRNSVEINHRTSKEDLMDKVFKRLNTYPLKTVEMSTYISIEDYDDYETDHPYFKEMMYKMIEVFKFNKKQNGWVGKVVEFGAGTGHFTIRLAEDCPDIEIEAIEIDWYCFQKLEKKVKKLKNITPLHEDSRSYDPGGAEGKYKYIFSSFSDHHIKDSDKLIYLENIRKNLEKGGRFIVGDEFLPSHNRDNKLERKKALESYHNFIIQEAENNNHYEVAELERKALQSGLDVDEGKDKYGGDFKLSCEQYEEYLKKANLTVVSKYPISPKDKEKEVGGIYVYEIVGNG